MTDEEYEEMIAKQAYESKLTWWETFKIILRKLFGFKS